MEKDILQIEAEESQKKYLFLRYRILETIGRSMELSKDELLNQLITFLRTCDGGENCLSDCKGMYFCELPPGHSGPHMESGLYWEGP